MIRKLYNQIPYPALKTKRGITKYIHWQQSTKGTRGKPNEQLFPKQLLIQLPKYVTYIIGEPKYKYGQQKQVTVRNHNRSTALELSVLKYRGGGLKPVASQQVNEILSQNVWSWSIFHDRLKINDSVQLQSQSKLLLCHWSTITSTLVKFNFQELPFSVSNRNKASESLTMML